MSKKSIESLLLDPKVQQLLQAELSIPIQDRLRNNLKLAITVHSQFPDNIVNKFLAIIDQLPEAALDNFKFDWNNKPYPAIRYNNYEIIVDDLGYHISILNPIISTNSVSEVLIISKIGGNI